MAVFERDSTGFSYPTSCYCGETKVEDIYYALWECSVHGEEWRALLDGVIVLKAGSVHYGDLVDWNQTAGGYGNSLVNGTLDGAGFRRRSGNHCNLLA